MEVAIPANLQEMLMGQQREPSQQEVIATMAYRFDILRVYWEEGDDNDAKCVRRVLKVLQQYFDVFDEHPTSTQLISEHLAHVSHANHELMAQLVTVGGFRYRARGGDPQAVMDEAHKQHLAIFEQIREEERTGSKPTMQ